MFRPMAITVIFALAAAFLLSLTFIPAMVALLIRGPVRERENIFIRLAKREYEPALRRSLHWRWAVMPGALLVFAASVLLFFRLGREFAPTLDEQDIAIEGLGAFPARVYRNPRKCSLTWSGLSEASPRWLRIFQDRHGGDGDRSRGSKLLAIRSSS